MLLIYIRAISFVVVVLKQGREIAYLLSQSTTIKAIL